MRNEFEKTREKGGEEERIQSFNRVYLQRSSLT